MTPAELADFRDALGRATSQPGLNYYHRVSDKYTQHVNVWTVDEDVRRHVFNRRRAEIARQLSQSRGIRLWHDQIIIKMPGNSPSPWHHDLPLWPMIDSGTVTCWLALVDVTFDMGCMHFIPGSHRWGRLAFTTLPSQILDSLDGAGLIVPEEQRDNLKPVSIELRAGSCTFHHALAMHYAGPNVTDRPLVGFITNYMPDGVRYSGQKHVTTDPLGLAVGQPIAGDLFPIVASADPAEVVSL